MTNIPEHFFKSTLRGANETHALTPNRNHAPKHLGFLNKASPPFCSSCRTLSQKINTGAFFSERLHTNLHVHKKTTTSRSALCFNHKYKHIHTCFFPPESQGKQVAAWITRNVALDKGQCWEGLYLHTGDFVEVFLMEPRYTQPTVCGGVCVYACFYHISVSTENKKVSRVAKGEKNTSE